MYTDLYQYIFSYISFIYTVFIIIFLSPCEVGTAVFEGRRQSRMQTAPAPTNVVQGQTAPINALGKATSAYIPSSPGWQGKIDVKAS